MAWELKSDRSIYLQLMEYIQRKIISGDYEPGEKLPSVRDLAVQAEVNPNTMQKALVELERGGLIYTNRTAGRFITEDVGLIKETKHKLAKQHVEDFIEKMEQMGFEKKEIISLFMDLSKEE